MTTCWEPCFFLVCYIDCNMVVEQKKKKMQTNMTMMMDKISVNDDDEEDDERKNKWPTTKKNQFDVMKFENKHETI